MNACLRQAITGQGLHVSTWRKCCGPSMMIRLGLSGISYPLKRRQLSSCRPILHLQVDHNAVTKARISNRYYSFLGHTPFNNTRQRPVNAYSTGGNSTHTTRRSITHILAASTCVFISFKLHSQYLYCDVAQSSPTFEAHLYNQSQKQRREEILGIDNSKDSRSFIYAIYRRVRGILYLYLYEPIATMFRLVHLTIIFLPLIGISPIAFLGTRIPEKDNERTGALFLYSLIVRCLELAGASFTKLGQWAASRSDIFPKQLCEALSRLHSHGKPHSLAHTRRIVEEAFGGRKFDTIFDEFIQEPLGVGAIAQVYKAKLSPAVLEMAIVQERREKEQELEIRATPMSYVRSISDAFNSLSDLNGIQSSWVAVKVLHPHVTAMIERDLTIMGIIANTLNLVPSLKWLSFPDLVTQFGMMMRLQLDLSIEANNLKTFRKNFAERRGVRFPRPYPEYSSRKLLVEEYVTGIPMTTMVEMSDNKGRGLERMTAEVGLNAFLKMLLLDNFIHADLHSGNIFVMFIKPSSIVFPSSGRGVQLGSILPTLEVILRDSEKVTHRLMELEGNASAWQGELNRLYKENYRPLVSFIDTGLVTELNEANRHNFLDLFVAVSSFDGQRVGQLMIERSRTPETAIDAKGFEKGMSDLVKDIRARTFALGNVKIADLLGRALQMVQLHHVKLEADFVNVVLSILLLEGIGRQLDPQIDLFRSSLPILRELGAKSGVNIIKNPQIDLRKSQINLLPMLKIWAALEARQFINASLKDTKRLVTRDLLAPNV